eukprot:Awhi_evm2s11735
MNAMSAVDWNKKSYYELAKVEVELMQESDATIVVSTYEQQLLKDNFNIDTYLISNIHEITPTFTPFQERE